MPHLIKLYIRQVLIGFVLSAVFVALLLWLNVANLGHLVTNVAGGWIAVLMLWVFNGIVFAGVQFALALPQGHGEDDDNDQGRRDDIPVDAGLPALVRVEAPRRR